MITGIFSALEHGEAMNTVTTALPLVTAACGRKEGKSEKASSANNDCFSAYALPDRLRQEVHLLSVWNRDKQGVL